MAFMEWKAEMSVGVPALDDQHRSLIGLINMLEEKEQTGDAVSYVISELERYAREHFRDEEALMAAAGYPELESHRAEHRSFEEWLGSVKGAYAAGGETRYYIAENVNAYLKGWFTNHILIIDMEYKDKLG